MSLDPIPPRRRRRAFDWSTAAIAAIAFAAAAAVYWRDGAEHFLAILSGDLTLFGEMLPKVLAGCLIGAFVTLLLPRELVARWVGHESGFTGLAVAALFGFILPGGPLTTDPLGGHVMLAFNTLPPAIGNIKAGKLRAIAVAAPQRLAAIPNVPTTAESGMPGLDIVQYYGLVAPAGTPPAIIARLNKELRKIVSSEDIKARIIADGGGPVASTPEEYAANIQHEEGRWAALIKKLGLKVE